MKDRELLVKIQSLACAKCEDIKCGHCDLMDEAAELYDAIREEAIEDFFKWRVLK